MEIKCPRVVMAGSFETVVVPDQHVQPPAWLSLRRTCAKLCHVNGGELEQIQFLLAKPQS